MRVLLNKERLKLLRELALIDSPQETVYDRITLLASKAIGAPVSLMSMVGADYQFFKSSVGLGSPWDVERKTPLSHSFCKHVVETNEPLVVTDAREVPMLRENLAIPDLDVIGYLGMPLTLPDGASLGSLCVIDNQPRVWNATEIEIVHELAEIVTYEIELRAAANMNAQFREQLDAAHLAVDQLIDYVDLSGSQQNILVEITEARQRFNI